MNRPAPLVLACLAGLASVARAEDPDPFEALGLPSDRSASVVFDRFLSPPSLTARLPEPGETFLALGVGVAQVAVNGWSRDGESLALVPYLDYEAASFEARATWGSPWGVALGAEARVTYLWGGFLDGFIASFHDLFGFPTNGRRDMPFGQVRVDVPTRNGFDYRADSPAFLVADPALHVAATLLRRPDARLSALAVAAVPLGLGAGLAGTAAPQAGLAVYADWSPAAWLNAYANLGGLLPLEALAPPGPKPMAFARLAFALDFGRGVLPYLDVRLQTSPVETPVLDTADDGSVFDFFARPNADLHFGAIFRAVRPGTRAPQWSFTVQEDPLSNNSADVSFLGSCFSRLGGR